MLEGQTLDITNHVAFMGLGEATRIESLEQLATHGEDAFQEGFGEDICILFDGVLHDLQMALSGFIGLREQDLLEQFIQMEVLKVYDDNDVPSLDPW